MSTNSNAPLATQAEWRTLVTPYQQPDTRKAVWQLVNSFGGLGSSYYQLPRLLQWFTGNIGFHHIHHLSPRIPNYHLQQCHEQNPTLQRVVHLTLKSSLQTAWLALWNEKQRRLVSFQEALQIE